MCNFEMMTKKSKEEIIVRKFLFFVLFFCLSITAFADVPPEGEIILMQSGIDLILEQEQRHIVVAPYTIPEDPNPSATWINVETGMADDREIYSKYYHSLYGFWDGPYQVSQTETDASRAAMCVTENGWLHSVYHGDHDESGTYEVAYVNNNGQSFTSWQWQEIISPDEDEALYPTIVADGNDLWVVYKRFWQEPNQQLNLQHGVWNGSEENPEWTWWNADDIKTITESTGENLLASLFPDSQGNLHFAYANDDNDLTYRNYNPNLDQFSPESVLDTGPENPDEGKIYSPSLVVDSADEVHITYSYSYHYQVRSGNLGTTNYIHGSNDNWSDVEHLQYNEDVVDSFCTYPIIGIDNDDGVWVTYSWFQNFDQEDEFADIILKYKPSGETWEEGINTTEDFDEIPSYPSLTHRVPDTGANIIFMVYEDLGGWSTYMVECMDVATDPSGIGENYFPEIPKAEILHQNHPNPFNPVTTISYQLPEVTGVKLSIYNSSGQLVETLIDETQEAGYHSVAWNAQGVASGVYFYKIETGRGFEAVRKCVVLK